jgi:hypothetical protein
MELTEFFPHVARALSIDWDEATRYVVLNAEFWMPVDGAYSLRSSWAAQDHACQRLF